MKSSACIEEDKARGITKWAKPVGVVCAITPSIQLETPVNKAMMAIKGRNAIIIAASPAASKTTQKTVEYMRAELKKIRAPEDLVGGPTAGSKDMTQAPSAAGPGGRRLAERAYSSGTPGDHVRTGNVPVIIDETADLDDAAKKICASKIFDNSTSCSSENSLVIVDAVYDKAIASAAEKTKIQAALSAGRQRR